MLSRSFTRRETVLLIIMAVLLVVGLYAMVVFLPTKQSMESLTYEIEDLQMELDISNARLGQYNAMRRELDEIFALPDDKLTYMPEYDNIQTLMVQLNAIFNGLEPTLSFGSVQFQDKVAVRPIQFSFNAPSYDVARSTLAQLTGTGQRCLLDNINITPAGGKDLLDGPVSVSGSITFYELAE